MKINPPDRRSDEWITPPELFRRLDRAHAFTLDPCSTDWNAKTAKHFTVGQDGLKQSWANERVFMNPPYSQVAQWCEKAVHEVKNGCPFVFGLLASRPDSKWWHEFVKPYAWVRHYRGRVKFTLPPEIVAEMKKAAERRGEKFKLSGPQFASAAIIWTEELLRK